MLCQPTQNFNSLLVCEIPFSAFILEYDSKSSLNIVLRFLELWQNFGEINCHQPLKMLVNYSELLKNSRK